MGWGIRNEGSATLAYWIEFTGIQCPVDDTTGLERCPITPNEINDKWFTFKNFAKGGYTDVTLLYELSPAEQHVKRVELRIPNGAFPGLYLIQLTIYDRAGGVPPAVLEVYDSTEIFLTVS